MDGIFSPGPSPVSESSRRYRVDNLAPPLIGCVQRVLCRMPATVTASQVLDDVEPPRRPVRDHDDLQDPDARKAYLQPSLKAEPLARPELERDHPANVDFERYRGRV